MEELHVYWFIFYKQKAGLKISKESCNEVNHMLQNIYHQGSPPLLKISNSYIPITAILWELPQNTSDNPYELVFGSSSSVSVMSQLVQGATGVWKLLIQYLSY